MVASEAVPLAKTGGVADVVGGLSRELVRLGHNVKLALPRYPDFGDLVKDLADIPTIPMSATPVPLQATTEFVRTGLPWSEYIPERLEFFGQVNLLKGGIVYADLLNTVSPTYAREIQMPQFGYGLEGVLQTRKDRLFGIINGIDYEQWSPTTDPYLPSRYTVRDLAGKKRCKTALQRELKLAVRSVPLIGLVSRLVAQKGIDLILDILSDLLALDRHVVVLGSAEPAWEG